MSARRRFLLIAVVLSVAVHVGAALLIVLLPRVLPQEARPQEQGTVELLMVEQKGAAPSAAAPKQDSPPAPPQPPKQEAAAKPETPKPEPQAVPPPTPPPPPAPPVADSADEPAPPPVVDKPQQEAKAEPKPEAPPPSPPTPPPAPPPKAAEAPVFDLAGTESESNAEALGGHILPASPDNRFRNRPPIYPDEAVMRGEHGSVLLLIHVSEAGTASAVEVVQSSGVPSLDQAALTAVRKWRFHPALREGEAVPFDMPFRFVFEVN